MLTLKKKLKMKSFFLFYDFIEEFNQSLQQKVFYTNWILADVFVLEFCEILIRLGYLYGYKKKYKNKLCYIKLFFSLRNGFPFLLKFEKKFKFINNRWFLNKSSLKKNLLFYDLIFLTPYGFCTLVNLQTFKKLLFISNYIFVGYFLLR